MNKGFYPYLSVLLLLTAMACEKNDPEPLTGDILGQVTLYDQDRYILEDQSGVRIILQSEDVMNETLSLPSGEFAFLDIDYGNYRISLEKAGYIHGYGQNDPVHHLGGYNPTRVDYRLYEIPHFGLKIDSAEIELGSIALWLTMEDYNSESDSWYFFRCFFNGAPEISKEAYFTQSQGWTLGIWIENDQCEVYAENYALQDIGTDSIYICVYPEAAGQHLYSFNPEALGNASNVLAVKNPFLEPSRR